MHAPICPLVDHALRRALTTINTSSSSSGRTPSLVFLWVLLDSIQDNWVKTELNMAERGAELDAPVRRAEELDVLGG